MKNKELLFIHHWGFYQDIEKGIILHIPWVSLSLSLGTFYWYTLHFLNNQKLSWGGSISSICFIEKGIQSYICSAKRIDVDLNNKYTYFFRFKQFEGNSWSSFATRLRSNNNVSLVIFSLSNSTYNFTGRHPFRSEETVVPTDC